MQWLGVTFTRRFNNKHMRSGHLFQGRFKSIIVENDAYLMRLSFYIHRNPLRAGIVQRLADYKWSSYPVYAYGRKAPDWLSTEFSLAQFNATDKHKAYREKAQRYAEENKKLWEDRDVKKIQPNLFTIQDLTPFTIPWPRLYHASHGPY